MPCGSTPANGCVCAVRDVLHRMKIPVVGVREMSSVFSPRDFTHLPADVLNSPPASDSTSCLPSADAAHCVSVARRTESFNRLHHRLSLPVPPRQCFSHCCSMHFHCWVLLGTWIPSFLWPLWGGEQGWWPSRGLLANLLPAALAPCAAW